MKQLLAIFLLWGMSLVRTAMATDVEIFVEYIHYFDADRPPVIESYTWDEKRYWTLRSVDFDSDGDWELDASMIFWDPEGKATQEDLKRVKVNAEKYGQTLQGKVLFSKYDEPRETLI